uniref:Uncharacterized protein n=1 Tax=Avena sativa TaxID=4498 RepID=A0ACD5TEE1_AVESA
MQNTAGYFAGSPADRAAAEDTQSGTLAQIGDCFVGRPPPDDPPQEISSVSQVVDYFAGRPGYYFVSRLPGNQQQDLDARQSINSSSSSSHLPPGGYFIGRPANQQQDLVARQSSSSSLPPGGYFIGRPANQQQDLDVRQTVSESLPGGYFVGRPANQQQDLDARQTVNESLPGGYFVGRPANQQQDLVARQSSGSGGGIIFKLLGKSRIPAGPGGPLEEISPASHQHGYFPGRPCDQQIRQASHLPGDYFVGLPRRTLTEYEYNELVKATDKFACRIRLGEFGIVHKAILNNTKVLAVQTLQKEKKGDKNHKNFVHAISTLNHKNLLKLDGYCMDEHGTFLCYEHQQPYQTLEDRLFGTYNTQLNWQQRVSTLKGVCEGLQYLEGHRSAVRIRISLKVDNILLHEDQTTRVLTAKLAEFGISKQLHEDAFDRSTDYLLRRRKDELSPEIDINSFGIILLVMVSGVLKTSNKLDPFGHELIADVKHHYGNNNLGAWRDPFLSYDDCEDEIEKCVELALRCTRQHETSKPCLGDIARILANLGGKRHENSSRVDNPRRYHNLQQKLGHDDGTLEGSGHVKVDHVREYGYDELTNATDNFADHCEIGRGAFGIVYKAVLHGKVIAVKKLQKEKFAGQFMNEVSILTALRHKNLVKLEGYCFNRHGTMLCYEHLPGGTLQHRLKGKNGNLDWKQRYHIIQGICKGLQYLHDECPDGVRIVHMDLKTDNVLVHVGTNGVLTPKIGDFGISWPLDSHKQHEYVDKLAANINCTPREYQVDGKISTGVDIYSFGLIMLEMIIGQTSADTGKKSHYGLHIINKVQNHKKNNDLYTIIDQSLGTAYQEEIHESIEIALNCVEIDEYKRPNIAQISLKLAQIGEEKVKGLNNMLEVNKHGSTKEQQHEVLLLYPDEVSSHKSDTEVIHSSTNAGDHTSVQSIPSDLLLDFTLDFDAIDEEEPIDDEHASPTSFVKQEEETKKAMKQLYEAIGDVFPYQIAESSGLIEDMVNEILACTPSDELQAGLMELVAVSKGKDAIKRATERATRKAQINEKKSQCAKLKAVMQEHAVEAKKLSMQQSELRKRKEALRSELEKIDSKLNDLPASIAQEKSMGMAAQAEGRTLAEQVREEEAEVGDTSADDALLAQVRKVQKGVCAQLEGILQRS